MPPAYPVRVPSAPITRWHGMTIGIGLLPLASPTAREAALDLPRRFAIWPYDAVSPYADLEQQRPDGPLELAAARVEWQVELLEVAVEVGAELAHGLDEHRVGVVAVTARAARRGHGTARTRWR